MILFFCKRINLKIMELQNVCYFQMYLSITKSHHRKIRVKLYIASNISITSACFWPFLGPSTYVGINNIENSAENQQKIAVFLTPPTSLFADVMVPKGQLISKCPFGVFKSPQKTTTFFKGFLP